MEGVKKVKKNNSTNTNCTNISEDDFLNHFKELFGDSQVFTNADVENHIHTDDLLNNIERLDNEFSLTEVLKAISSLKKGKSAGIIPEMIINCKDIIAPILCKLFNHMYVNCIFPSSWTKGIIVPIPKKGNINDVNNYRGITLSTKIFSILLDSRLREWAENIDLLLNYQYGFRKAKSTVDCIFVLSSLIDKVINHENKKYIVPL